MDPKLEDLITKLEIAEVIHLYCRAVDRADMDLLRSVYHQDAQDYHGVYNGPIAGLLDRWKTPNAAYPMTHHAVSNILIDLKGSVAYVESYFNAVHRRTEESGAWDEMVRGRYIDRFEKRADGWRIAKRLVVYDWSRVAPATGREWWESVPGEFRHGARNGTDVLYAEGIKRGTRDGR
jgi:ketosteroid isomerase-like protein